MVNSRFIYCDVGNTLVDCTYYFKAAASTYHLHIDDIKKVFDDNLNAVTKGSLTPQQLWEKCIERYAIPNTHDYNFLQSWVSDYEPIREMHDVIIRLQSKYRVGLLSNIYKGMLPLLLEKGLLPKIHYDQIVFSCDVGMMKPNPDIYIYAQNKAHVDPHNILLIDDRQDYLDGAAQAGWQTFLFDDKDPTNSVRALEEYIAHF